MTDLPQAAIDAAAQRLWENVRYSRAILLGEFERRAIAESILDVAAPLIAAAERERIRQLANDYDAVYPVDREDTYGGEYQVGVPFADLLEESP
jgi:hypothetical protein